MVTAVFKNSNTERVRGLWQYDYGQVLRIHGLILPTAVEIDFSLQETGGESTSRVGITRDGVTDVVIPDSMLENGGATQNYSIYAFIYLTDETSGETIKKIIMSVTSRPKPEAFDAPEDAELFREAIAAVNKSAGRAETAEASAEAWAHGHADYPERDEDNAKHYADESKKDAEETKKERTAVSELAEHIDAVAIQVNEDKTDTDQYKDQASASAAKALQSEQAAKSSETAAMEAKAGAEAAEGQAELFAAQTEEDKNTVEQAKDVVMGIGQEVVENRNYVQQSVGSFGLIHQQAVTDVNNAGQTQTERVEEAGTAQVSAVQEAASEIIADREQISNNKNSIDSLKSDLDNVYESAFDGKLDADIHWVNGTIDGTGDSSTVGNTATINSNSPYNKTRRCAFYDLKSDMNVKFLNTCVLRYIKVDSSNTILDSQVNITRDFVLKKGRYALVFYIKDVSDLTNYKISDYINIYYDIPIFGRVTTAENGISENKKSIDMFNLTPIQSRTHNTGFPTSNKIWGNYTTSSVYNHVIFQVSGGETVTIKAGSITSTFYGCLKSYSVPNDGDAVDYSSVTGFDVRKECAKNNTVTFQIPEDAKYLFIVCTYGNKDTTPVICKIDGLDYAKTLASQSIVDLVNSKLYRTVRWCAIGDSITEGYISCEEEPKYKLSKTDAWAYKLADMTGWILANNAIGGTGYVKNHDGKEDAGWQIAKTIDFTQFDFVTIAFGVNDWKYNCTLGTFNDDFETPTTIYGAMRSTIETIIASNPLCKIFMISPVNCSAFGSESGNWGIGYSFSNNGTLEQIYEAEKEVAEYYGIEFIDMLHNSIINRKNIKTCLIDNVHPTAETHTVLVHEIGGRINWY